MKTCSLILLLLFFGVLLLAYCTSRTNTRTGADSTSLQLQAGQIQTVKLQNDKDPPPAGVEATIREFNNVEDTGILEGNDGRTYKVECVNPELQDPTIGSIFVSNGDGTFKSK